MSKNHIEEWKQSDASANNVKSPLHQDPRDMHAFFRRQQSQPARMEPMGLPELSITRDEMQKQSLQRGDASGLPLRSDVLINNVLGNNHSYINEINHANRSYSQELHHANTSYANSVHPVRQSYANEVHANNHSHINSGAEQHNTTLPYDGFPKYTRR
jgi:hypothetical protein